MSISSMRLIENLNNNDADVRLDSLRQLAACARLREGGQSADQKPVNNHIHTFYSFSPYSPAKAIWMACSEGLSTAGVMDHDSVSGAEEFIKAGKIAGIATTVGVECRGDFSNTALAGKKINNPDQRSIAYVALHGIPHPQLIKAREFFAPLNKARNARNRHMVERINNELMKPYGVFIDYDSDVSSLSRHSESGSTTERHILMALSLKLVNLYGKGAALISFLKRDMKLTLSKKAEAYLADVENAYYEYDLLNLLKGELTEMFYIDAAEECPDVRDIINLSDSIGAISAYPYLGDVGISVTGDKKSQRFEDGYLDLLFDTIKDLGFKAVTYMPSRNTPTQLAKIREMCDRYEFFQISGEDVNSPRCSFFCEALKSPEYSNLYDSAWALIGHESISSDDLSKGMFSEAVVRKYPDLARRILIYKEIGLKANRKN